MESIRSESRCFQNKYVYPVAFKRISFFSNHITREQLWRITIHKTYRTENKNKLSTKKSVKTEVLFLPNKNFFRELNSKLEIMGHFPPSQSDTFLGALKDIKNYFVSLKPINTVASNVPHAKVSRK